MKRSKSITNPIKKTKSLFNLRKTKSSQQEDIRQSFDEKMESTRIISMTPDILGDRVDEIEGSKRTFEQSTPSSKAPSLRKMKSFSFSKTWKSFINIFKGKRNEVPEIVVTDFDSAMETYEVESTIVEVARKVDESTKLSAVMVPAPIVQVEAITEPLMDSSKLVVYNDELAFSGMVQIPLDSELHNFEPTRGVFFYTAATKEKSKTERDEKRFQKVPVVVPVSLPNPPRKPLPPQSSLPMDLSHFSFGEDDEISMLVLSGWSRVEGHNKDVDQVADAAEEKAVITETAEDIGNGEVKVISSGKKKRKSSKKKKRKH